MLQPQLLVWAHTVSAGDVTAGVGSKSPKVGFGGVQDSVTTVPGDGGATGMGEPLAWGNGAQPGLAMGLGKRGCDPGTLLLCKTWVALGVQRLVPTLSPEEEPCGLRRTALGERSTPRPHVPALPAAAPLCSVTYSVYPSCIFVSKSNKLKLRSLNLQ